MSRKAYLLIALIFVLTLILSFGCSKDETAIINPPENPQEKLQDANSQAITPEVQETQPKIIQEAVSPDGQYTAYIVSLYGIKRISLGQGTDFEKAKEVYSDIEYVKEVKWSPNSKFFFAGNSDFGNGAIFSVNDLDNFTFRFETGPFWSPDGNKFCYTRASDIRSATKNYSVVTFDVVVDELESKRGLGPTVFAKGTEDYYYKVNDWNRDGEIKYERISKEDDRLLANLSNQYANYLWVIDSNSGKRQELGIIPDLRYQYFNISPDRNWLSMVKLTFSGGEAEGGIPAFYNLETGELKDLGKEFSTWFWNATWFKDSSKIMLNETSIYDLRTGELTEYRLPEGIILLGAKPSPDGTKLAVFSSNHVHHTGSKGEKLTVYVLNTDGKILKTIQTPLLPKYSDNTLRPVPVEFDWLLDNQNLVIEAWDQETYETTLQKLDLANGELTQLASNTYNPQAAPDGKKIAVFSTNKPEKYAVINKLKVLDTNGKVLNSFELESGNRMIWDSNSEHILVMSYGKDYKNKVLTTFNINSGETSTVKAEISISPLYLDNENLVCIGGPLS